MKEDEKNPTEEVVEEPTNEQVEESTESAPEASPGEPAQTEAEEEVEEPQPSEPVAEDKPSRRESLRIQQLLTKIKQTTPEGGPSQIGIDYSKELEAEPEVIAKLVADRRAASDAAYKEGLDMAKTIQFKTRLEVDAPRVESKYPQLDKDSAEFHPAVADALNTAYLSAVGYDPTTDTVQNPGLRYSDYIDSMMELADEIAGEKVSASSKNIAKQAANTGLRPDGSVTKRLNLNKAPEDMTDEELAAVLSQAGMSNNKK